MMQFPKQIFSSFVLRALFGSFFIFAAGSHFTFVHPGIAQEIKTVLRGSVLSMLGSDQQNPHTATYQIRLLRVRLPVFGTQ